jgi:glycosyltransferase involved in cell wall biosynthesis
MYFGMVASMTLCLTMIVRNEASTIARCLAAAKPLIDCWCIVDTGSTDETMSIIMRELSHLPGELYSRPWLNFGYNRTESLNLAREWLSKNNYDLNATWCLMLDADHELQNCGFNSSSLAEDCYLLEQFDEHITYANARLLRASIAWLSEGVTHEYWTGPGNRAQLASLRIHDHNDGGSRVNKFVRDERLLLHGLIDEPNNERYVFYLAQTYECLGKTEKAIELYRRRTQLGGFEEERWMARLRLGRILLNQNEALGVHELLIATEERPSRAESLFSLAHYYREHGKNQLAYLFAKRAQEIPKPGDTLFVEHPIYDRGIAQELSIVSYYTGDRKTGILACERLLSTEPYDANVESNLAFYAQPLNGERGQYQIAEEQRTFDGTLYNCSNPSVCGDVVLVRLVNYTQEHGRWYVSRDRDGKIRTRNAIARQGETFTILDESILQEWNQDTRILGLEDIRLVSFEDRLYFSATCCQVPGAGGNPQVVLGRLSTDLRAVEHLVPIQYERRRSVEKNWLLWPYGDELRCVYSFSPFTWWTQNVDGSIAGSAHMGPTWSYEGRLRGSAPAVALDTERTLFLTHDVARRDTYNVYTHRFVIVSGVVNGSSRVRVTAPFLLEHSGIEYACGATIVGDDLLITYGYEDREARWVRIPLTRVAQQAAKDASDAVAVASV